MNLKMRREDYHVAIICALPVELAAVEAMLVETHPPLPRPRGDDNSYSYGSIGGHNVVLTCLPYGVYGLVSAANVANRLDASFPCVQTRLMVGIAGGIPSSSHDVRLGDIVVSMPTCTHGGVVQYDLGAIHPAEGKSSGETEYTIKGHLNRPPDRLLAVLSSLKANDKLQKSGGVSKYLQQAAAKYQGFRHFQHPGRQLDMLFQAGYEHEHGFNKGEECSEDADSTLCVNCDRSFLVERGERGDHEPRIHYGTIASGNNLIRHGLTRDRIGKALDALCFEMEAAGLMNNQFLVIRGICDYADSHKSKVWQPYAAAVAAAFARAFLETMQVEETIQQAMHRGARDAYVRDRLEASFRTQRDDLLVAKDRYHAEWNVHNGENITAQDAKDCQNSLYFYSQNIRYFDIKNSYPNTCAWILRHAAFRDWVSRDKSLIWIKGKPGSGKSTLMRYIFDNLTSAISLDKPNPILLCFFFHARGDDLQHSRLGFLRSVLFQIFSQVHFSAASELIKIYKEKPRATDKAGEGWSWTTNELLYYLTITIKNVLASQGIVLFVDALDECGEEAAFQLSEDFHRLMEEIADLSCTFRICFSCRHYPILSTYPGISIWVERENKRDIEIYTEKRLREIGMTTHEIGKVLRPIVKKASGVFQWVALVVKRIETFRRQGKGIRLLEDEIARIPPEFQALYHDLFQGILPDEKPHALKLMQWVCFAFVPLTVDEVRLAMIINESARYGSLEQLVDEDEILDMSLRVSSLSCGLIETRFYKGLEYVQFIHQSAVDFFLQDGFKLLSSEQQDIDAFVGISHRSIAGSCIRFFALFNEDIAWELTAWEPSWADQQHDSDRIDSNAKDKGSASVASNGDLASNQSSGDTSPNKSGDEAASNLYEFDESTGNESDSESCSSSSERSLRPTFRKMHVLPAKFQLAWLNKLDVGYPGRPTRSESLRSASRKLLAYTVQYWLKHCEYTDLKDVSHEILLNQLAWPSNHLIDGWLSLTDFDAGCSKNRRWAPGMTLLHLVALHGLKSPLKAILKDAIESTQLNAKDSRGRTALSYASGKGYLPVVEMLLEKTKIDINSGDKHGRNSIYHTIGGNHLSVLERLLKAPGIDINHRDRNNNTPLLLATRCSRGLVQILLDRGANLLLRNKNGEGPLHTAILYTQNLHEAIQIVSLLLQRGCDVNATDKSGRTPLHQAALLNPLWHALEPREALVRMLLKHAAKIDSKDSRLRTPLHLAVERASEISVRIFLHLGAEVDATDKHNETPLHYAARLSNINIAQILLEYGANIESKNLRYHTALHFAADKGGPLMIQLLLKHHAPVDPLSDLGETPLHNAVLAVGLSTRAVEMLLDHGADPNVSTSTHGNKPLHDAVRKADYDLVRLLISRGANANIKNHRGWTPLFQAGFNGDPDIARLIVNLGAEVVPGKDSPLYRTALIITMMFDDRCSNKLKGHHMLKVITLSEFLGILLRKQTDEIIHEINYGRSAIKILSESGFKDTAALVKEGFEDLIDRYVTKGFELDSILPWLAMNDIDVLEDTTDILTR